MKRVGFFILLLVLLVALTAGFWGFVHESKSDPEPTLMVRDVLSISDTTGFTRATEPRKFVFPTDHGPHPDFKTEWWYVTGNLTTMGGRKFGFQLTFFRSAVTAKKAAGPSEWHSNQIYMAHFAITDVSTGDFYYFERFSRGAAGLAGAQAVPFRVWLDDWTLHATGSKVVNQVPELGLRAADGNIALSLRIVSTKPLVLQGEDGLSQKGPERGNASYYYSLTRLQADGEIRIGDANFDVTGAAWLDREWSTSALGARQVGWDWFALQFEDNTEVMLYQIRDVKGAADPFSRGIFIGASGEKTDLRANDFDLTVLEWWSSPRGGIYPAKWRLKVPKLGLDLEISPQVADQELNLTLRYWEGTVRVTGRSVHGPVGGQGYVELTGYAR